MSDISEFLFIFASRKYNELNDNDKCDDKGGCYETVHGSQKKKTRKNC